MKVLLITVCVIFIASCATKKTPESSLTNFIIKEESGQFGYHTAWSKVLHYPLQDGEPESASQDFEKCKTEVKKHYIRGLLPSTTIQLAFLVECMSEKGWYWRAIPYGYVSSL
jgi:hypothetical protein